MRVRTRRVVPLAILSGLALFTILLFAYNPEQDQVNNKAVPTRWNNNSVTWNLNPTTMSNVQAGSNVQGALAAAFNTWQTTSMMLSGQQQTVVNLNVTLGQVSSTLPVQPNSGDCLNVVSFGDTTKSDFPSGTIAFTSISTVTASPGQTPPFSFQCSSTSPTESCSLLSCIADADIMFNPADTFATITPTPASAFDIQTIATHEIGHLLGLDHSGLGNAVMYPFGDTGLSGSRILSIDDEAGIAALYPASNFAQVTGTLSGTVTLGGSGIFAAHVVAIDANTGNTVMDGLTAPDGTYSLVGVPPGSYNVLALPLAGFYTLDDFGGWSCGYDEAANAPPCCDPSTPSCTGKGVANPTNYTGKFF